MRQPYKKQITIGGTDIKEIEFDLNCRHEIIPILIGLQRIYKKRKLLGEILDLTIKMDTLRPFIRDMRGDGCKPIQGIIDNHAML